MFLKRIQVREQNRTLVIKNGQINRILRPGSHLLFVSPLAVIQTEVHHVHKLVFRSRWTDYLLCHRHDLVDAHFTVVHPSESQVAMVSVDGDLYHVVLPGKRLVLWKDAAQIEVEFVNIVEGPAISETMLDAFEHQDSRPAPDQWSESDSGMLTDSVEEETWSGSSHGDT